MVTLQFKGHKLDKKDFFGKSDPFLVFYRCNEDNRLVNRNYKIKKLGQLHFCAIFHKLGLCCAQNIHTPLTTTNNNKILLKIRNTSNYISFPPQIAYKLIKAGRSKDILQIQGLSVDGLNNRENTTIQ